MQAAQLAAVHDVQRQPGQIALIAADKMAVTPAVPGAPEEDRRAAPCQCRHQQCHFRGDEEENGRNQVGDDSRVLVRVAQERLFFIAAATQLHVADRALIKQMQQQIQQTEKSSHGITWPLS